MKVAISLPDEIFNRAEALASERKISRSALYSAAIEEYIRQREDDAITAKLNEVYAKEDSALDDGLKAIVAHSSHAYDKWE